jgi:predicted DNA-binding protein (MmcQ/YjbR family)
MNFESIYSHCIAKPHVHEDYPFDKTTLVFKVGGKIFLLIDSFNPVSINVKCNPEKAIELREQFDGIKPGFHMNKKHWITIDLFAVIPENTVLECINHSYELVFKSLSKKTQEQLVQDLAKN